MSTPQPPQDPSARNWLAAQSRRIVRCTKCPRLRRYCAEVARVRRAAFRDEEYWGRPVPNFGDPKAALLVVGLAPAAHGANRTGRLFTGDRSGEWLYRALYKAGFANQPTAQHRDDGLRLTGCLVTALVLCAPPGNRPALDELRNCAEYLEQTLARVPWRVLVALGGLAWQGVHRQLGVRSAP